MGTVHETSLSYANKLVPVTMTKWTGVCGGHTMCSGDSRGNNPTCLQGLDVTRKIVDHSTILGGPWPPPPGMGAALESGHVQMHTRARWQETCL